MRSFNLMIMAFTTGAIIIFCYLLFNIYQFKNASEENIIIEVSPGENLTSLSKKLEDNNLVFNKYLFKYQAMILKQDKKIKPGEYKFRRGMRNSTILSMITDGKIIYRKITIPEGLTVKEIINILNSADDLSEEVTLNPKEGYLLPETYSYPKGEKRDNIIVQMQDAMNKQIDTIWKNRNKELLDCCIKSVDELINLASIVEKETPLDHEKPIVASVYLNRLKKGMRLQADPTVVYGAENYQGDITYKMLRSKTPYNTYLIKGLPKTPIANPGIESLKAVASPKKTDYLFFVADGKGGHDFSETYQEHRKKVADYLKFLKNKEN